MMFEEMLEEQVIVRKLLNGILKGIPFLLGPFNEHLNMVFMLYQKVFHI